MIRLSIVIPCWHDVALLEKTLLSVLQNRPEQCEILVVHPGIYEDPYDLSDEVRFIEAAGNADRVSTINSTIEQSAGEVIHLLEAGVEVEEGWSDAALSLFDDAAVGAVIPLVLNSGRPTHLVAAGMKMGIGGTARNCSGGRAAHRQRLKRTAAEGPSMYAGFFRRSALQAVGGFEPRVGYAYAALDAGRSLRQIGYRVVLEPASKAYAVEANQIAKHSPFTVGRRAERIVWRSAVDRRWLTMWLSRFPRMAWETIASVVQPKQIARPFGRIFAWTEWISYRRHHRRLRSARESRQSETAPSRPSNVRIDAAHDAFRSNTASEPQRVKV